MTDEIIKLERFNNRLPSVAFGLSWDFSLHADESAPKASILGKGIRRLLSHLRHQPDITETDYMVDVVQLPPHEQEMAQTLWARREQLANLDAKVLILSGGKVIARMIPTTPEILDGAITNTGDDVTGSGGGDDELVTANLNLLPDRVDGIVFYVESDRKRELSRYLNPSCHVSYMRDGRRLVLKSLQDVAHSGFVLAILKKQADGEFVFNPVQTGYDAADPNALEALVMAQV